MNWKVLLTLLLIVAACSPTVGDAGPLAVTSPAVPGGPSPAASALASSIPSPGSLVSSTPPPSSAPTVPVASATPTAIAARSIDLVVYLLRRGRLVPVQRQVPATLAVARAAMTALLAGPTPAESAAPSSLATLIPGGTQLLDIALANGVAVVDLTGQFESGGGAASMFGRLAQVVYTLTQFPSVTGVTFRLDGQPVTSFSGEGIVLTGPSIRADYRDFLPVIFLDRPAWGGTLPNPARVSGLANVFEAQFVAEIVASDGTVLAQRAVSASCGNGCWGTFDVTIPYQVDQVEPGWVTVYDLSAKDGTRQNGSSYPVTLTPGG
jgi:germination protein M